MTAAAKKLARRRAAARIMARARRAREADNTVLEEIDNP